ncbi:MAG: transcription termination/antitermination protein NusA [Eubacterium sp.]|nr:transcription termination/antitermination protein NusA [Eubacterium sp.]
MQEIIEALDQLEKEKGISKDLIMEAIEKSLNSACEKDFGKDTECSVHMDRETGEIKVFAKKLVVEEVYDSRSEMSLEEARQIDPNYNLDDEVPIEITTRDFGRIAAQKARGIIVQAIKEGERDAVFSHFVNKEKDIITGVVQRFVGNNLSVSLDDRTDAILNEKEMIPGEYYRRGDRIKLYVVEVKKSQKGFRIVVSRTHPDLVRRLFEREVTEIADGTVEIRSISREAGSRSKIAVWSNDENVDAVGSCVGMNGARVNAIVEDLGGEKIDIIEWNPDPAIFIENALSPSKVVSVTLGPDGRSALVIVPDFQLSLAIGKEGQNARLAARLTGFKIDIKSETQAAEMDMDAYYAENYGDLYEDEYYDEDEYPEDAEYYEEGAETAADSAEESVEEAAAEEAAPEAEAAEEAAEEAAPEAEVKEDEE